MAVFLCSVRSTADCSREPLNSWGGPADRYLPLVSHVVAHVAMEVSELLAALSAAVAACSPATGPNADSGGVDLFECGALEHQDGPLRADDAARCGSREIDPMPALGWLAGLGLLAVVKVVVHVHPLETVREAAMTLLRALCRHSRDPDVREAAGYGPPASLQL
jgi:hypothetical protein